MEILTKHQQKAFDIMLKKSGKVVSRDEIAQTIWNQSWLQKYSDWRIDRLIYLLRGKIKDEFTITTVRNSGYVLVKNGILIPKLKTNKVEGTLPTESYLEYMNNPKNKRKVLKDLFTAFKVTPLMHKNILVINSYSYDNVDAVYDNVDTMAKNYDGCHVYFSNFDTRALKMHQDRIEKLRLSNFYTEFDDIRNSIFKGSMFDLIINDFRLNFNTTDRQNVDALKNIYRISKPSAKILISVVIDPRYENKKYGDDQENAPTNKDKPWTFKAEENLTRFCFTVPYYKRLFEKSGFRVTKEFDIESGKKWNPPYRRFLLQK